MAGLVALVVAEAPAGVVAVELTRLAWWLKPGMHETPRMIRRYRPGWSSSNTTVFVTAVTFDHSQDHPVSPHKKGR